MIQFSQVDLRTPEGTERVLRLFASAIYGRVPIDPRKNPIDLTALGNALAPVMQKQLGAGGVAPLDLTDLLPTSASSLLIQGTHNNRLVLFAFPASLDLLYWETDRNILYVSTLVGGSTVWHYAAGTYIAAFASRPADLSTNDV